MQRKVTQIIKRSELDSLLNFHEKEKNYNVEIEELTLRLREKSKELESYTLIIKQIESSVETITQNSENLKLSLSERDNTIETLKSELQKCEYTIKDYEFKISELNKHKLSMDEQIKVLDEEQQEIEEILRLQVESNKDLKYQFADFKKSHDDYIIFKTDEKESLNNWYVKEIENLHSHIVCLNKIIFQQDHYLSSCEEIIKEHLFNCIIEGSTKINEHELKLNEVKKETEELKKELESEILKNILMEEKNTSLVCLVQDIKNENKKFFDEAIKKENHYKSEIESLKELNFNIEQNLVADKNNARKEIEEYIKKIEESELSNNKREMLLKNSQNEIETLNKHNEYLKNEISKLTNQQEQNNTRINELESYCNESDDEITVLRNKIKDLKTKIDSNEVQNLSVEENTNSNALHKKLEIQNGIIQSLKDSENALKENYSLMEHDVKDMLESKEKLRNELSNVTQNYESIKILWKQENEHSKGLKEKITHLNTLINNQEIFFNNLRKNRHDREYLINILEKEERIENEK